MTPNAPANFIGHNRFRTFLISNLSRTQDAVAPHKAQFSRLWPVPWQDFRNVNVDTRVAGFGPLSPWILLGSVLLCGWMLIRRWKAGAAAQLIAAALLVTVFVNPEPWWARYVPQLWLVPFVFAVAGWLSRIRGLQAGALVLVLICAINAGKSGAFILQAQAEQSRQVKDQLDALEGQRLEINLHCFTSVAVRLSERHIPFRFQQETGCAQPAPMAMTSAVYCEGKY